MKTKIIKVKGDWQEVVNDCRATVGKEPVGKEPSHEWKQKILISEHSPIRDISIKWFWKRWPKCGRAAGTSRPYGMESAAMAFTGAAWKDGSWKWG